MYFVRLALKIYFFWTLIVYYLIGSDSHMTGTLKIHFFVIETYNICIFNIVRIGNTFFIGTNNIFYTIGAENVFCTNGIDSIVIYYFRYVAQTIYFWLNTEYILYD